MIIELEMERPDDLIGNTQITNQEFMEGIKTKKTKQLKAKLALGVMLIKSIQKTEQDDPRLPTAVKSLETQTAIIKRELKRRRGQPEEETIDEPIQENDKPGPLDRIIGMKTLDLRGKADMG